MNGGEQSKLQLGPPNPKKHQQLSSRNSPRHRNVPQETLKQRERKHFITHKEQRGKHLRKQKTKKKKTTSNKKSRLAKQTRKSFRQSIRDVSAVEQTLRRLTKQSKASDSRTVRTKKKHCFEWRATEMNTNADKTVNKARAQKTQSTA